MATTLEELEALQAQVDLLKKKAKTEIQSQILPFIRDGKAKCEFRDFFYPLIITSTSENLNTLIKYIEGNQDCGYHFGCSVSDVSTIRYDDEKKWEKEHSDISKKLHPQVLAKQELTQGNVEKKSFWNIKLW